MFHLGWFLTGISNHSFGYPWDGVSSRDWAKPDFYTDLGRALERACFDLLVLEDSVTVPDAYGGSIEGGLGIGRRSPKNDPSPYVPLIAQATRSLGIAATFATSFYPPFLLARLTATLNQLTEGRVAWNIVTGSNNRGAENFGFEMPAHDDRYDIADEYVDVVRQLWDSWDPDAIVLDHERGVFADHTKVRPVHFQGKHFRSRGPLNTTNASFGHPVIVQAGGSPRGRQFAAEHAETVIGQARGVKEMKAFRDDIRARMVAAGRDPDTCKVLFIVEPTVAETTEEAQADLARRLDLWDTTDFLDVLVGMSDGTGVDFKQFDLDAPLPTDLTTQGHTTLLKEFMSGTESTMRDVLRNYSLGSRLVGTPDEVADEMGRIAEQVGGDGFLIHQRVTTRRYVAQITDGLVPALQARGLVRNEYRHVTMRDNLLEF